MVLVAAAITNVRRTRKESTLVLNIIRAQISASAAAQAALISLIVSLTEGTDIPVVRAVPAVAAVIERSGRSAGLFKDQMVTDLL